MSKRTTTLLAAAALSVVALAGHAGAAETAGHAAPAGLAAASAAAGPGVQATRTVHAPFTLEQNQSLASDTANLVMQSDGNLVIYDEFGRARWASRT
ncbi:hypothetical protein HCK01_28095, partial [Streptomyces sp. AA8]|nr:hypothetical protein [Streptomyces telluris]